MLIEFIGLPGSGKTTIFEALAVQLHKERLRCKSLRMAAQDRMDDSRQRIRFLKRRAERVGLYGCFSFAHENPALFDALFAATRHDIGRTLWNMEMLAQIHFVTKQPLDDTLIFMDEGFLHRGVSAFSDRPDRAAFQHYLGCLTHDFVTVHVETPPDMAIARAANRANAVPFVGKSDNPEEGLADLREFAELVRIACDTRRKAGKVVLTVDGTLSPDLAALQLAGAIMALASPAMSIPADVSMRKHRKKPSFTLRQA